jgi:hypothetical protein
MIHEFFRNVRFRYSVCMVSVWFVLAWQLLLVPISAQERVYELVSIRSPKKWQVVQRRFNVPQWSHANHPGGPAKGFADVVFEFDLPRASWNRIEYRMKTDKSTDPWRTVVSPASKDPMTRVSIPIKAGGWHQVEWTFFQDSAVVGQATSEPFGVGDIYVVAGQSYATNCNDEIFRVMDPMERVVAFDWSKKSWRVAHDPQPAPDGSDGGSIWPLVGDMLIGTHGVPVGFVNVAVGATSTTNWDVKGPLFARLVEAGSDCSDFRAVLWQQGESDVLEKSSTATYVDRLKLMRQTSEEAWGREVAWFLAKSTLHPTVYVDPEGEQRIRQAIETLISDHRFERGPDTDKLDGANRGPMGTRRHWTGMGQRNAAHMWFAVLHQHLERPRPSHEAFVQGTDDLHLWEPAWASETVYNESSILLKQGDAKPMARLAFPTSPDKIQSVRSANRSATYKNDVHWRLSDSGIELVWIGPLPFDPLTSEQLCPPKDAPNSYRHRAGNPEQNVFYAPGKWFHEHNLEITYRVTDATAPTPSGSPSNESKSAFLRVKQLLASKRRITIGVSGDSISTGLDASGTTATAPYQPGYPELVAAQLTRTYGSQIELVNRSVPGWSIANGVEDLDNLLQCKPDLLIVAYGMNDVGRRNPGWFVDQAKQIEAKAKSVCPDVELLWVATMLGNREWIHTPRDQFFAYRDAIKGEVAKPGTLADLTDVWDRLLKNKHDLDLTGNGLNHPNDFGHRLYAQAILQLLR